MNKFSSYTVRSCLCGLVLASALASCSDNPTGGTIAHSFFVVDRVVPRAAPPGSYVTIHGENFYHDTTKFHVTVAGVPAKILSVNPYTIRIKVPENARGKGIAIIRDGQNWMIGHSVVTPFQVIDSPYPFRGYELQITGVTGITAYSYSSDDGYMHAWSDTSELDIHQRQVDFSGPDEDFCDEYSNGDTARICSSTSNGDGGYDRFTLVAVVDSVRGLITRLEVNQWGLSVDYPHPSKNETRTGGSRSIFRNIPYTRQADSSLQVDVSGAHIFDYIASYESSTAETYAGDRGLGSNTRSVRRLLGASADARFKLRLFKYP